MRYSELFENKLLITKSDISEAPIGDAVRSDRYYHGTSKESFAKLIMKNGIQPPDFTRDGRTKDTFLRPISGKIYITPELSYALIYALGGNIFGSDVPKSFIEKDGKYGYVFVITGDQLTDVQPDEDVVGELYASAKKGNFEVSEYSPYLKNPLEAMKNDKQKTNAFLDFIDRNVGEATRKRALDGDSIWQTKLGKTSLKKMPDSMKIWLVSIGSHVAHEGAIHPIECWRIDKTKSKLLKRDGSNFFDFAKKVR